MQVTAKRLKEVFIREGKVGLIAIDGSQMVFPLDHFKSTVAAVNNFGTGIGVARINEGVTIEADSSKESFVFSSADGLRIDVSKHIYGLVCKAIYQGVTRNFRLSFPLSHSSKGCCA